MRCVNLKKGSFPVNDLPDACPYCECELETQEAEPDVGLDFDGLYCPDCIFEINSYDFPMYSNDL